MTLKLLSATACVVSSIAAQDLKVAEIRLRADPEPKLRPLETVVIQVKAYTDVKKEGSDGTQRVRIGRGGAKLKVEGGGWLSKPFKFQGREDETYYSKSESKLGQILSGLSQTMFQDAFLYSAPDRPGRYQIEAELDGKSARITVEVDNSAPSRRPKENQDFPPEQRIADPYRRIVEHWAPVLAQETWWQPKSDMPARFDFDGDWRGDNNWDNLDRGASQAYVYYAAVETHTHWFLIYNVFHPRDYSDTCVAGTCHENDNEGLILTVRKDGSEFGKLELMETLAHNNIYSFVNDKRIRSGVHSIDGEIELHEGRPVVFIESGGHGIYGTTSSHARYDVKGERFSAGTGITFVYRGKAARPKHANDRNVGYELLPISTHWWTRAFEGSGAGDRTYDEYYVYQPFGGRPAGLARKIGGTFYGRKMSSNKAKPFWGWHDTATRKKNVLNTGQWALDPAYAVTKNVTWPAGEAPSTDYTFNPYLGVE